MRWRFRDAFTLVELLVVIGIIAILISVLLPTLAKARQSANFIDCQARLRQMGQAMQIYVNSNKGMLPWGVIRHTPPLPASYKEPTTFWHFTVSEIMTRKLADPDGVIRGISAVFKDQDTIPGMDSRYVNHYTANPRILYDARENDDVPGPIIVAVDRRPRKLGSIKRGAEVFVIWDGPQAMDYNYNTYEMAAGIDAWGLYINGLCEGNAGVKYDRAILPGQIGVPNIQPGQASQKKYNIDVAHAFDPGGWLSHLRFRHMNNKRLAALCLDGHVEPREVGTVMVRDIYTNPK
jgi:prepilin-type N-terminal cleavage/methylation domain-containing protein